MKNKNIMGIFSIITLVLIMYVTIPSLVKKDEADIQREKISHIVGNMITMDRFLSRNNNLNKIYNAKQELLNIHIMDGKINITRQGENGFAYSDLMDYSIFVYNNNNCRLYYSPWPNELEDVSIIYKFPDDLEPMELVLLMYDPSNGTLSKGSIFYASCKDNTNMSIINDSVDNILLE